MLAWRGLKASHRTEVIGIRWHNIAGTQRPQALLHFGRRMPVSGILYEDDGPIVFLQMVARVEAEDIVFSHMRPFPAAGQDPASEPRTFEVAALDLYRQAPAALGQIVQLQAGLLEG